PHEDERVQPRRPGPAGDGEEPAHGGGSSGQDGDQAESFCPVGGAYREVSFVADSARPAVPPVDGEPRDDHLFERVADQVGVDRDHEEQERAGELDGPGPQGAADRQRHGGQGREVADQVGPADMLTEQREPGVGPLQPCAAGAAHRIPPTRSPSRRSTYLARVSTSMLTFVPTVANPRVVACSVVGIRLTVNEESVQAATVRLTPSTAMDPFSTT